MPIVLLETLGPQHSVAAGHHYVGPVLLRTLLLATALALTACSSENPPEPSPSSQAFSAEVRENFLTSCVENAAATAGDAADEEQFGTTCRCILGKVEQEYDEAEFADFEQRLLNETATAQESAQLEQWSTSCAEESAG